MRPEPTRRDLPADASAARRVPSAPYPGVYTFNDKTHLDPAVYPIYGGHKPFHWYDLEPWADDDYQWRLVEEWIEAEIALGKPVGIGINSYDGACCGGDLTPPWVYAAAPEAEILCQQAWPIPRYWHPQWMAAWEDLIKDLAARYDGDPRLAWVEISTGMYGENWPADFFWHAACLEDAGLTSALWVQTMKQIVDIYDEAFSQTPLLLQFAPYYRLSTERREITEYAARKGIGLKHNGLWPDTNGAIVDDPGKSYYRAGQYDPFLLWGDQVATGWEGQEYQLTGDVGTLWGMYSGLNKHVDYILLGEEIVSNPSRRPMLEFAQTYLGRTVSDTPAVWVALREHDPYWLGQTEWFPQRGNYDFWLYQMDTVPGGRTVPEWEVSEHPEGRWTRRTDQTRGQRYMVFDVDDAYLYDTVGGSVRVDITYYDQGQDRWALQYDGSGDPYSDARVVQKTDSGQWRTEAFTLGDARFANRQSGGGDFRIDCLGDGDEYIHFVKVTALPERPLPPAEPLPTGPPPGLPPLPPKPPVAGLVLREGLDRYTGTEDATISSWTGLPQPDSAELRLRSDRNGPQDDFTAINDNHSVLIRFDLSPLPEGSLIQDAALRLHAVDRSLDARIRVSAYEVLRPWDEAQATWERSQETQRWDQPGANGAGTDRSAFRTDIELMDKVAAWYEFHLPRLLERWVERPGLNYGVVLRDISLTNLSYSLASSEHPQVDLRPHLVITYTMPAWLTPEPSATATPTPSSTLTATPTFTPTGTPTVTATPNAPPSATPTDTVTATTTPSVTATFSPTATPTPTKTERCVYVPLVYVSKGPWAR